MNQPGFTPGPWMARIAKVPSDGGWDWGIAATVAGSPVCIAEAFEVVRIKDRCPASANAHLIAAAPDIYAALVGLMASVGMPDTPGTYRDAWNEAEAALAKARGEST